jgi:hypothetical protein
MIFPAMVIFTAMTERNRDYGARSRGIIRVELSLRVRHKGLWNLRQWGNGHYGAKTTG